MLRRNFKLFRVHWLIRKILFQFNLDKNLALKPAKIFAPKCDNRALIGWSGGQVCWSPSSQRFYIFFIWKKPICFAPADSWRLLSQITIFSPQKKHLNLLYIFKKLIRSSKSRIDWNVVLKISAWNNQTIQIN